MSIKIRDFKIREIAIEGNKVVEKERIAISESYLTRALEIYNTKKLKEEIDEIIKVDLNKNKENALTILKNGVEVNNKKYIYLATSAGLMKKADTDENYEGECLFIAEDLKSFKDEFENVISLNKLSSKKGTDVAINKDVISRISLALSDGCIINNNAKILVLPELEYKFASNYLQFAENEDKSLNLDKFELEHKNLEVKHICNDGCGFAMPSFFEEVQREIGLDYTPTWLTFRKLGLAGKGLIVRFDYKNYLEKYHNLTELFVKDMWGTERNLFDYDVILNESQTKWAKWFDSYDEYEQLKQDDQFSKYRELLDNINIIKVNKREGDIKTHTELNYQILSNLALTKVELDALATETEDYYARVIDGDVDATRIMLNDVAREDMQELSSTTKIHKLLQVEEEFINLQSTYKMIGNLINKKINNLAGGKIFTEGNFKTICQDPFSYFDSLVNCENEIKMSKNGLKSRWIFIPNENVGHRTIARMPLNSCTEIQKVKNVSSQLFEEYFANASSDLCILPLDDMPMLMSGADFDGDILFSTPNSIIYNSVIEDIDEEGTKWNFRNQFDGAKAKKYSYTDENVYESIVEGRGNKIGQLSNKGIAIADKIMSMPYRINGKLFDYRTIIENAKNAIKENEKYYTLDGTQKELNDKVKKEFKNLLIDGKIETLNDEDCKIQIYNQFQDLKKWSYYLLILEMIAIDMPKTGVDMSKEMSDKLKELGQLKKPNFVYYAKFKTENKQIKFEDCTYTNSTLNNFSSRIIRDYGAKARELENKKYSNDKLFKVLKNADKEINEECLTILNNINNEYVFRRANLQCSSELKELSKKYNALKEEGNKELLEVAYAELQKVYEKRNLEWNKIDLIIQNKIEIEVLNKFTDREILRALANVKSDKFTKKSDGTFIVEHSKSRVTSRFVIEFLFETLINYLLDKRKGIVNIYKENANGAIHCLFKDYKITTTVLDNTNLTKEVREKQLLNVLEENVNAGNLKEVRIRIEEHSSIEDLEIYVKDNVVYNSEQKLLGTFFKEHNLENGHYEVENFYWLSKRNINAIKSYDDAKSMSIFVKM
ncbi:RNA dependent RNA polymerase [Romboutsia lituseburensis]|uniref:RNA dependent RNA polymerase n=1 Tax=Romboutsia lituseburensis TaxID=1537 RepID=UPI0022EB6043|nr:hypothetical protein [Romboutsia lituseburensis]